MISAPHSRRGGRTPHLGWLLPGAARGEGDIRSWRTAPDQCGTPTRNLWPINL